MGARVIKLPKSVRVGALDFTLHWASDALAQTVDGLCDRAHQEIHISRNMAQGAMAETILHEILHAIWGVAKCGPSGKREERVVNSMAPVLLAVLRDNRALFTALADAVSKKGAEE